MSQSMNRQNGPSETWPITVNWVEPTPIGEGGVHVVDYIGLDESVLFRNEDLLHTFLSLFSRPPSSFAALSSSASPSPSLWHSTEDDQYAHTNWYNDQTFQSNSIVQSIPNNELFLQRSERLVEMMPRTPVHHDTTAPQHHALYSSDGQDQSHDFCIDSIKTKERMMEARPLGEMDEASLTACEVHSPLNALHYEGKTQFPAAAVILEDFSHQQPQMDCTVRKSTAFGDMQTSSLETSKAKSKSKVGRYHIELWNAQFIKLVKFKQIHGHSDVPCTWSEDRSLSHWVRRQRHQYKLKVAGGHNTLSNERQEALESIGFVWDPNSSVWDERYEELVKFHRVHGHCRVPRHRDSRDNDGVQGVDGTNGNDLMTQSKHKQGDILATWVKCQRQQYRHNQLGIKTALTRDRIARLDQLGFSWTVLGGSSSPEHPN